MERPHDDELNDESAQTSIPAEKRRKKSAEAEEREGKKKYTNILFSCVTVRQLRGLLNRVEKEPADMMQEKIDGEMRLGERKVRRLTNKAKKGVKRLREENSVGEVFEESLQMKTFNVAAISMGLFIANGGQMSNSSCAVTFCFFLRHIRYDFSYSSGPHSYRAGYKVAFNHLEAITFQDNYINLKLSHPAEQEYCSRESFISDTHSVVPCNEFDITLGQYKVALVHVIRMNSDESSLWIYHLLEADRHFFEPLIKKITNDHIIDASEILLPVFTCDPTTYSLYDDHPGTHYDPSYSTQQNNVTNAFYPETFGCNGPSAFVPYSIHQQQMLAGSYNGYDNTWQQTEMFTAQEATIASPNDINPQIGDDDMKMYTPKPADMINSDLGLNTLEQHNGSNLLPGNIEDEQLRTGINPESVNSAYVLTEPEPVDSEYVPQKSDSQYILSDLDMLFP